MSRICNHWSFVGPSEAGVAVVRADCKQLQCPRCGRKRLSKYRDGVSRAARELGLSRFITLTLDPEKMPLGSEDSGASVDYIRQVWRKFRVTFKRRYPQFRSFIAVVELHKSGMAHLHVLVGFYVEQAWISEAWSSVGGGRIVDIRYRDIHRITPYITKYLSKDLLLSAPPRKRRITTSRDIHLIEQREKNGYALVRIPIESIWLDHCAMENRMREEMIVNVDIREGDLYFFEILPIFENTG
jgi:hypothetical protein